MKVIKYLSVGLSIGFVCTTMFAVLFMGLNDMTKQILAWFIASALYGLSSMLFEIKTLKTLCISIVHYVLCLTITGINIYLFYQEYFAVVLISFTVIYIIIFIVMWLVDIRVTVGINKKLSEKP